MPNHSESESLEPTGRKALSIRLSAPLHDELAKAKKREDRSINEIVADAVATYLAKPEMAPSNQPSDIKNDIARDAVRFGVEAIGPLKGIAKYSSQRDQWALACVLWVAAARLIQQQQGPVAAAAELRHTANMVWLNGRKDLAIALWREALTLDPDSLESANRLGQELHHLASRSGDDVEIYAEAEQYLKRVIAIDNRARLFHGWSAYYVQLSRGQDQGAEQSLDEVADAMKTWSFGNPNADDRKRWVYQLRRLERVSPERARALVVFAERNAGWAKISLDEGVRQTVDDPPTPFASSMGSEILDLL